MSYETKMFWGGTTWPKKLLAVLEKKRFYKIHGQIYLFRDDRIRTCDFHYPKVTRYQAALHPVMMLYFQFRF